MFMYVCIYIYHGVSHITRKLNFNNIFLKCERILHGNENIN